MVVDLEEIDCKGNKNGKWNRKPRNGNVSSEHSHKAKHSDHFRNQRHQKENCQWN